MAHLLAMFLAAIIFVFLEASSGEIETGITVVTDFVYDDRKNNNTERVVLQKITEATNMNASNVKIIKKETKEVDGFFTAIYNVTTPSCQEVSGFAVQVMKNFSPVIFIRYKCPGEAEMEFLRNLNLGLNI
ncbi:unnamed protein product [Cylicocyclus nassatus]|uniref:Uncharacterized protein n=1 Tax=Cylicocyclus nassatus TaxID=53992 RepID=A0AA36H6U8_CYLNA|nr:unnamed protein product [Cylicocyclus nassatus]